MLRFAYLYLTQQLVTPAELATEYDLNADTYQRWSDWMGGYADAIIRPELLVAPGPVAVLDFACGSGALTKRWLDRWAVDDPRPLTITGVDFSSCMLTHAKTLIDDPRLTRTMAEGVDFLNQSQPHCYDAILCGWALAYFDYQKLARLFARVLKPNGMLAIIANAKHDISDIERILVELLVKHRIEVRKVAELGFNLPDGAAGLRSWFAKDGFVAVDSGEGEKEASFASPQELFRWLQETSAIAGILPMFAHRDAMKEVIIDALASHTKSNGAYRVCHRFAWGILRKGDE